MSLFNSSSYYRLYNDRYGLESPITAYTSSGPPHDVRVSKLGNYTSENWQLFYQSGCYFIRNHDYQTNYHLGIDKQLTNLTTVPVIVLHATSELNQQWVINKWGDGTYYLTNKWINGNGSFDDIFLGVDENTNSLVMLDAEAGSQWIIDPNPSIGPVTGNMLQPYTTIQTSPNGTYGTLPSSTATGGPPSQSASPTYAKTAGTTPLEKAAIVVGVVLFMALSAILFIMYRRYKKTGKFSGRSVPGPTPPPSQPEHGRAEVVQESPPNTRISQAPTLTAGVSRDYGRKPKAIDEESIELSHYGRPSVDAKEFV